MPDYRVIPSIEQMRQRPRIQALEQEEGTARTLSALRAAAQAVRSQLRAGRGAELTTPDLAAASIEEDVTRRLATERRATLRTVINATGVIIHTNLGRAPIARRALMHAVEIAGGYSNLEYDLASGTRGSRHMHVEALLTAVTGADAALVVNNNAAATWLMLAGLASNREVLISRGELVEIGGGFRIPDVMAQSGAILREVGTTNRTRVSDYAAAVNDRSALILRVHRANFRIEGFTEQPTLADLVTLVARHRIPLCEDLGSGCLLTALEWEPSVQASVRAGVDLICFSADKMLGGPQAGVIVGHKPLVDRLRSHPLMRALRVDKLTLAILESTLLAYVDGSVESDIPVVRMISLDAATVAARARMLAGRLNTAGWRTELTPGASAIGGGSAPGVQVPTMLLGIAREGWSENDLLADLRTLDTPVIARVESGRVVLDLRTVDPDEDELLAELLLSC